MKKFTFFLVAALFCGSLSTFAQDDEVRITPAEDPDTFEPTFTFNENYKYYGILLDDETKEANLSDEQYVYIGPDDKNGRHLWPWENTFSFPTTTGINSFGVPGAYTSVQVGAVGWSGLGYAIDDDATVDLSGITDEYTFHMALKATDDDVIDFYLTDGSEHQAHLVFGDKAYDGHEPIANFERDGEWYNIDIPMTYLEDNFGLTFKKDNAYHGNILCLLAGGRQGFTIDYDAIFFYGPKGSTNGVKEINAVEKNAPSTIYTVDGKQVSQQYAKANKGIYIVKQGAETKKVVF